MGRERIRKVERAEAGGFGHYPGSPSDQDAIFFHVGSLVMTGYLRPVEFAPEEGRLMSWGHLMAVGK